MATERRNLYRILFVQPEAPPEVIKASYRALMSTLRAHPDLGGDTERAAQLNAAYAVLSDPEARARYDRTLKRPSRTAAAAEAELGAWASGRFCPFCRRPFEGLPSIGQRCARCGSPLGPAPAATQAPGELVGRRRGERHTRHVEARLRLPGEAADRVVRLRDVSLTGLSLISAERIHPGTPMRVIADTFETIAVGVACRAATPVFTVHAKLLTLQLLRGPKGVYVDAKA